MRRLQRMVLADVGGRGCVYVGEWLAGCQLQMLLTVGAGGELLLATDAGEADRLAGRRCRAGQVMGVAAGIRVMMQIGTRIVIVRFAVL